MSKKVTDTDDITPPIKGAEESGQPADSGMPTDSGRTTPIKIAPAPPLPQAATVITFQLGLTNESSLSGSRYFNIFPPYLKNISTKSQVRTALVSQATSRAATNTNLMWKGGEGALALLAITEGITVESAERVSVTLGDIVSVDWSGTGFTLTPTPGGPTNVISLTFAAGLPADTQVGLVVGPAPILVAALLGQSMALEPDLSPAISVSFGTAFQLPEPDMSDLSKEQVVTLKQTASDAGPMASAQIKVGLDNRITETG